MVELLMYQYFNQNLGTTIHYITNGIFRNLICYGNDFNFTYLDTYIYAL